MAESKKKAKAKKPPKSKTNIIPLRGATKSKNQAKQITSTRLMANVAAAHAAGSNDPDGSASFGADMVTAAKKILELDTKIAVLNKERGEIRAKYIKGNDLKLRDFNTIYRLWKLEDDERKASVDAMLRTAVALDVQGDLFPGSNA